MEEQTNSDHRHIGVQQELFFFHELSPGSAFWLPKGARIFNKLQEFMRSEYFKRGFEEVKSPVIAKKDLWAISGHWDKYKENMFSFKIHEHAENDDKGKENSSEEWAMKAMNCPLHCLMFGFRNRSYKELPLRFADFGTLHRNEFSGALSGLTRVRSFHLDDAHLFCTHAQIKGEIKSCLQFFTDVYGKFGFKFSVGLSTRPEKFIGEISVWDQAEKELESALNESGLEWTLLKNDGAFYGPKIDIQLTDSLNRKHQCATIQLDFQLPSPERFNLKYVDENQNLQTPVIIHRAIYGSYERFIAMLCEHYAGKWPFWISPNQVMIVPVASKYLDYCYQIKDQLKERQYYVEVDDSDNTMNKKILAAQMHQYNYILVIGQKEIDGQMVNIRYRDSNEKKMIPVNELLEEMQDKINKFQ